MVQVPRETHPTVSVRVAGMQDMGAVPRPAFFEIAIPNEMMKSPTSITANLRPICPLPSNGDLVISRKNATYYFRRTGASDLF